MNPAPRPIHVMDADELRQVCASLRHEITQIGHWRRLVRARLDLTVARAVLPGRLGEHAVAESTARPGVTHSVLVGIAQAGTGLSVTDLPRLRAAEDSLADYESAVRRALMVATDALLDRMSESTFDLPLDLAHPGEAPAGAAQCTVSQRT